MATQKRTKRAPNRQARLAAARRREERRLAAQRKRRRVVGGVVAVVIVAVLGAVVASLASSDDKNTNLDASSNTTDPLANPDDTTPEVTEPPLPSAAGKPCVARTGDLPAGAPDVPVEVGPPPTKLVTKDLKVGDGAEVKATDTITVNYIGVSCSTGAIFDSSYKAGQPATFPLDSVIAGWTQGIPGMKVGGQRLLGIPSELAYGASGSAPDIAPDEPLWFVVDVVSVGQATN